MFGRAGGGLTFAASALRVSAFLIPADIAPASNDESSALTAGPGALNAKHFALQLPCAECAFPLKQEKIEDVESGEEDLFWIQGGANSVVVDFAVSEDGERLEINGETIYPLDFQAENMMAQRIYVNQVASSTSRENIAAGNAKTTPLEVTGSGVSVMEAEVVSPEGHMLVPIKHTIFELERQPVSLDEISITILKTVAGELFIVQVETLEREMPRPHDFFAPPPPPPEDMPRPEDFFGPPPEDMPHPEDFFGPPPREMTDDSPIPPPHFRRPEHSGPHPEHRKECQMLPASLCRLRNMVEDRFMGMRKGGFRKGGFRKGGCHGRKHSNGKLPGHIKPHFLRPDEDDARPHHHGRPHHMRPHGHHHGHHRPHFMHSFTRGLAAVLIPTMAGVAVGMTVSLVGLLVGRLIGFLWIKFYRGGRRGYRSVRLEDDLPADVATEKSSVILEQAEEALPVYEEAPAYDETPSQNK